MRASEKKDSRLPFDGISAKDLSNLIESKSTHALHELGGLEALLKRLKTDRNKGLSTTIDVSLQNSSLSLALDSSHKCSCRPKSGEVDVNVVGFPWADPIATDPFSILKKEYSGFITFPSHSSVSCISCSTRRTLSSLTLRVLSVGDSNSTLLRNSTKYHSLPSLTSRILATSEPHSHPDRHLFRRQSTLKHDHDPFHERRAIFGTNRIPEPKLKTIWVFLWKAFHEKTVIILIAAAVIEIGLGIYKLIAPEKDSSSITSGSSIIVASKCTCNPF
jgi:hypothetical protein